MSYNKPWTDFDEQLVKLQSRGLIITDEDKAREYLQRIGYYRLSGYLYAVRARSDERVHDEYRDNVTFASIIELYVFDKKLRQLCLDALERIEVALRVEVVHELAKNGALAYTDPVNFNSDFGMRYGSASGLTDHHKWLSSVAKNYTRSKQPFIAHIKREYGYPLPLWAAAETWDFGCLSIAYKGLQHDSANAIAEKFGILRYKKTAPGQIFGSYINGLRYLRNVCAHHSRLWNINVTEQPKTVGDHYDWLVRVREDKHFQARPFFLLCLTKELLDVVNPNSSWGRRLREHLNTFPKLEHAGLSLYGMGVQDDWRDWRLWEIKNPPSECRNTERRAVMSSILSLFRHKIK